MKTLISNARVVSPGVDLSGASVLISDGKISAVLPAGTARPQADQVVDAQGSMLMPGFIDIHSHGADNCDVCDAKTESVRHIAKRKVQEGVTTWLPTTLTLHQEQLEDVCASAAKYMANPDFAKTPGLHVEGPFINPKCAGAQNPACITAPNLENLKKLHNIAKALIVSLAPEIPGAIELIQGATAMGIRCSAAHTAATYAQLQAAKQAGLTHLTHFCNQMTALHHREIGLVGGGLLDKELKIELICDSIHLCRDMLSLIFSLKPIEQLFMITDSVAASWIDSGEISLGGVPVVVKDGVARVKETGALGGSSLKYNEGVKLVAEMELLPLNQLVKATSWNQAQSLGLYDLGKIAPGYIADLVLLNNDFSVRQTFINGEQKL